jgi:aspartyl-tRNA(Asn)/glutamyl-tRNA(Gln) amidotransferase subunit A
MPAPFDVRELTLERAHAALAGGAVTSEQLTRAFLDRIAQFNPIYNALICANPDAVAEACAVDRRRAAGEAFGPLGGVPVVVKDTMDMRGLPTTAGWSLLCSRTGGIDLLPQRDAAVVARLRSAGAIILGKTNVPVLSHSGSHANDSWAGPTYNVVQRALLPGGSSAGTASAVAASLAVLGLGEETGGSIQNPAAAQALVGLKPTLGLVPAAGVLPLCGLRDVVGPITRCVRDAALVLDSIADPSAEDARTMAAAQRPRRGGYAAGLRPDALAGRRLGLYGPGWRTQDLARTTQGRYAAAQQQLAALGAVLVEDPFRNSGFAQLRETTPPFADSDERGLESFPYDLQQYLEHLGPAARIRSLQDFRTATARQDMFAPGGTLAYLENLPGFADCLADPGRVPAQAAFRALKASYLEIFSAVFARERLDALVFPQMRDELPGLMSGMPIPETTVSEINIAGLPGLTVPAGYHDSGAPFALIFVGPAWSEADLLAYAYAFEAATRHRVAPALTPG